MKKKKQRNRNTESVLRRRREQLEGLRIPELSRFSMLAKIEGYLDSRERHFIAVGALHLAGPRGLVELLRKRGYVVRQK